MKKLAQTLKIYLLTFCIVLMAAHGRAALAQSERCAYFPCPNTPTGEDPLDIAMREHFAERRKLIKTHQYKKLWATNSIYSSSKYVENLSLPLASNNNVWIRLDPVNGTIIFKSKLRTHAFYIAAPRGDKRDLCPDYAIKVIDGSEDHAVIEKTCYPHVDERKRFTMGVEYFLYDMKSNTMGSFWSQETNEQGDKIPKPSPPPAVKKTAEGYRLRWIATDPNTSEKFKINTKSYRVVNRKTHEMYIGCTDLDAPKEEEHEGYCEGRALDKVKLK